MRLNITADGVRVGALEATPNGPFILYDEDWRRSREAFPISLTIPLTVPDAGPETVMPWLMNLLPEGEPLRAMTRALGVATEDIIGLIAQAGRDLAGALTIVDAPSGGEPAYLPIDNEADLERIISDLPAKPFLVGDDGVSMSLAGAQEKLPLALIDGQLCVPINGAPSLHILKPDNPRLYGSVQNEALFMVLARRCGLPVAPVTTGVAGARSYLLIDRYDRIHDGVQSRRLHQEDFCQALSKPPAAKYEHNRSGISGPTLADMFGLVRTHMTARDITRLLDAVIFNIAIGNVDSHAKNYSILLTPGGAELAPLYDLMSGLAWPNITQNHAQDVGGQRRGRHICGRHWRRMAEACGLSATATVRRVGQITDRILAELPAALAEVAAMPAGPGDMLDVFAAEIITRARTVGNNSRIDGDAVPDDAPTPEFGASKYDQDQRAE
jgi:serine/threonine-protein kinase HipA